MPSQLEELPTRGRGTSWVGGCRCCGVPSSHLAAPWDSQRRQSIQLVAPNPDVGSTGAACHTQPLILPDAELHPLLWQVSQTESCSSHLGEEDMGKAEQCFCPGGGTARPLPSCVSPGVMQSQEVDARLLWGCPHPCAVRASLAPASSEPGSQCEPLGCCEGWACVSAYLS